LQLEPELIEATKRALVVRLRNMGEYVPGSEIIEVPGYTVAEVAKATIELAAQGYVQFYGPYGNYILQRKLGDEFRRARWQRDASGRLVMVG
jgi:hypothetical protein